MAESLNSDKMSVSPLRCDEKHTK